MILLHFSVNEKPVIVDEKSILFVEECEGIDKDDKPITFTRVYLKQPIPGENTIAWIDVKEGVEKIYKTIK